MNTVDKRIENAREKHRIVHQYLISKSKQILASGSFLDLSFQSLAKYSKYSKTTIYSHFDSDIYNLYLDMINSFRAEMNKSAENIILPVKNKSGVKNQIIKIYEMLFDYIKKNPNLYTNLFLISVLILSRHMEGNTDQLKPQLGKLYFKLSKSNIFEEDWSLFVSSSIQYSVSTNKENKLKIKNEFFKRLKI